MKFTAQYPQMHIHKAGCADLAKSRNIGEQRETREAANVSEFITWTLGDPDDESTLAGMGYDASSYKILPCAK